MRVTFTVWHIVSTSAHLRHPKMRHTSEFEETVSDLFYCYEGSKSGNRQCKLTEIQKILNDPQVKVKECHKIRWAAFYEAIHAAYKAWSSLILYFTRHKDKTSQSMLKKLTNFVSLHHTHDDGHAAICSSDVHHLAKARCRHCSNKSSTHRIERWSNLSRRGKPITRRN